MAVRGWDMTRYCVSSRVMLLHTRPARLLLLLGRDSLLLGRDSLLLGRDSFALGHCWYSAVGAGERKDGGGIGAMWCPRSIVVIALLPSQCGITRDAQTRLWSQTGESCVPVCRHPGTMVIALRHHARHTFIPALHTGVCHRVVWRPVRADAVLIAFKNTEVLCVGLYFWPKKAVALLAHSSYFGNAPLSAP